MFSLCILFLLLAASEAVGHLRDFNCDSVPPSLWCESETLAQRCAFQQYCNKYKNATRNHRIKLTLLYESLCPGCQRMITEVLYPTIYSEFKHCVDFDLVPFGNAKILNGTIVCQHGNDECVVNRFESCAIAKMKGGNRALPFIHCLESQLKVGAPFDRATLKCYRTLKIDKETQTSIASCASSGEGERLQLEAGKRTERIYPDKHTHVPWMLFNEVSLSKAQTLQDSLPTVLCDWYSGDRIPSICENMRTMILRKMLVPGF